jgi:hypothetical protein
MVHTGFEPIKRCPFRVLAHQCHLTLMPQIKYDELPRVLLLRRMHSAFLAVRGKTQPTATIHRGKDL